jgi:hypothetical protein
VNLKKYEKLIPGLKEKLKPNKDKSMSNLICPSTISLVLSDLVDKTINDFKVGIQKKEAVKEKENKKKNKANESEEQNKNELETLRSIEFEKCLEDYEQLQGDICFKNHLFLIFDDVLQLNLLENEEMKMKLKNRTKGRLHEEFRLLLQFDFFINLDFRFFRLKESTNYMNVVDSKSNEVNFSKYKQFLVEVKQQKSKEEESNVTESENDKNLKESKRKRRKWIKYFLNEFYKFEDKCQKIKNEGLFDCRVLFKLQGKVTGLMNYFLISFR